MFFNILFKLDAFSCSLSAVIELNWILENFFFIQFFIGFFKKT